MKKLMNNKKGAILNLFSGAGDLIKSFFDILPKPIKFLLFLFLLLILGVLIGWLLNGFGVFCDSADNPVKISNILISLDLVNEIPSAELIDREVIEAEDEIFTGLSAGVTYCSYQVNSGIILFDDGTREEFVEPRWFYNGRFCSDCETGVVYEAIESKVANVTNFNRINGGRRCVGDVFRKEQSNGIKDFFCGGATWKACEPPKDYFYSAQANLYLCENENCTGITLGDRWDDKLSKAGARLMYPEGELNKKDAESMVQVSCTDYKPTITVYGIPVFDYRIWLIIMLITLLVGFYIKYKKA